MRHGLVRNGEPVIADEGPAAIAQLLPAGRWSHVWSPRLAGAIRSPLLNHTPPVTFSVNLAGGKFAGQSLVVDQAFFPERMTFINQLRPAWVTLTAGGFGRIAGGVDEAQRRVFLELATKSLNNYFPPRTGFGGVTESELDDPRSWFRATRVYQHAAGKGPQDELGRFALVCRRCGTGTKQELIARLADLLLAAAGRWNEGRCDGEDVRLLAEALAAGWLPNQKAQSPALTELVDRYRQAEKRLQPDRTIGTVADWNEGRDERIAVRGSYTDLGDEVPRGNIRFFGGEVPRALRQSSGRLELARSIANDRNPLTARVLVNRVWLNLFGEGLVRTPDDFGHLGEPPIHPQLLDHLATQFIEDGWSLKKLVTRLVSSATWRQSSRGGQTALTLDAENRLWHYRPMRGSTPKRFATRCSSWRAGSTAGWAENRSIPTGRARTRPNACLAVPWMATGGGACI